MIINKIPSLATKLVLTGQISIFDYEFKLGEILSYVLNSKCMTLAGPCSTHCT